MATYLELKAKAESILKQAEELRKEEKQEVVKSIRAQIREYGITASELGFTGVRAASKKVREPAEVRYHDGKGNTWTGRGRMPTWLALEIEAGRDREEFAV